MAATAADLLLRLIQAAEVLEHHAPLLGRETGELVPRRIADFWPRASRPGEERSRNVDTVTDRGAAGTVLLLIRLVTGEAAARVEQLAVEALLSRDSSGVEPSRLKLPRELARFLRPRRRTSPSSAAVPGRRRSCPAAVAPCGRAARSPPGSRIPTAPRRRARRSAREIGRAHV